MHAKISKVKEIITTGKKAESFVLKLKQPPKKVKKEREPKEKISKEGKSCKKAFTDEQKKQTLKKKRASKLNVP